MEALGLSVNFCHVFPTLGFAIELVALAMVDLGGVVGPYFVSATTGGLSHGCVARFGCCLIGRRGGGGVLSR